MAKKKNLHPIYDAVKKDLGTDPAVFRVDLEAERQGRRQALEKWYDATMKKVRIESGKAQVR